MTVSMLEMVLLLTSSSGSSSSSRERYPDLLRLISEVEIVLRNIWWRATPQLNVCPDYFTSCGISQDHWPRSADCGWRSSSVFLTCSGHCIGYLDRAGLYQINNHLEPSLGIKRAVSLSEAMLLYSIVFVLFCKNVLLVKVTWNLNWLTDRLYYHIMSLRSDLNYLVLLIPKSEHNPQLQQLADRCCICLPDNQPVSFYPNRCKIRDGLCLLNTGTGLVMVTHLAFKTFPLLVLQSIITIN